ncbi:MAG: 2,3-bisphosphoglycerate-dependent phosphoglycerate mutase [Chlamydiales bacterium]|nr:2,3-bisphosphoglycerate-dependent phosphoglycerate mutase [Chlamydiales bacterium]
MTKLILLRHGQSEWNRLNLFTGWVDVPLSKQGIEEALEAGKIIRDIPIDVIATSTLIRAQMTAMLAMVNHSSGKIPVVMHPDEGRLELWAGMYSEEGKKNIIPVLRSWQLNERYYGELQGLNKAETAEKYGVEQVKIWRRSYNTAPPKGESLAMTAERTLPFFKSRIAPALSAGKNVLVSAHGNSLRSILMYLDKLSEEEVVSLEIPTGVPIFYDFKAGHFTRNA